MLGAGRGSPQHRAGSFAGSQGPTLDSDRRTGGVFLPPVPDPSLAARRNGTMTGVSAMFRNSCKIAGCNFAVLPDPLICFLPE